MTARYPKIVLVLLAFVVGCQKDSPVPAVAPSVSTGIVSEVTFQSARVAGEVLTDGNAPVTARGIVYSTTTAPTIGSSIALSGDGTGGFVSELSSLLPETKYYVRAFATNTVGTSYGSETNFTTLAAPTPPTVGTRVITNITNTTAESGGEVLTDGGSAVTARGVCWSTTSDPTITNSKTSDGTGVGLFNSTLTGLNPSTLYYVRAYATNTSGTSYGSQRTLTTSCASSLAGNVSYVNVVTAAVVPIDQCQPSVSGTTTLTLVSPGVYELGDASFGQYDCAWADSPARFIQWAQSCSNQITTQGSDQYGILFDYVLVSNNGTTLVLNWFTDYGDAGTVSLTRTGGWPLNLTFL